MHWDENTDISLVELRLLLCDTSVGRDVVYERRFFR